MLCKWFGRLQRVLLQLQRMWLPVLPQQPQQSLQCHQQGTPCLREPSTNNRERWTLQNSGMWLILNFRLSLSHSCWLQQRRCHRFEGGSWLCQQGGGGIRWGSGLVQAYGYKQRWRHTTTGAGQRLLLWLRKGRWRKLRHHSGHQIKKIVGFHKCVVLYYHSHNSSLKQQALA